MEGIQKEAGSGPFKKTFLSRAVFLPRILPHWKADLSLFRSFSLSLTHFLFQVCERETNFSSKSFLKI